VADPTRLYIESTIPSYVAARPAKDLLQAARQRLARRWWHQDSQGHQLYISELVLQEIGKGDSEQSAARLELVRSLPILEANDATNLLARKLLASNLVPATAGADAVHIAVATVHRMDFLLTWNCRHIANGTIRGRLRSMALSEGYALPEIVTPEELVEKPDG